MKRFRWLAIVVAVMVLGAVVCSVPRAYARAAQAGSLHITPSRNGEGIAYDAYRIAGDAALPQNDQLN